MMRRTFLTGTAALAAAGLGGGFLIRGGSRAEESFPVSMSRDAWKKKLTPDAFAVLRDEATERPFSSPLLHNAKKGLYTCAGCDTPVYSSDAKFDSGTGWPSFYEPVSATAIGMRTDHKLIYPRTEVHCATCGGHLGHVFDDGPPPTGKRHCINGVALGFTAGRTTVS